MITKLQREKSIKLAYDLCDKLNEMKEYDLSNFVYAIAFKSNLTSYIYEQAKYANKRNNNNIKSGYIGDHVMYYNLDTSLNTTVKRSADYYYIVKLMGMSNIPINIAKNIINQFGL